MVHLKYIQLLSKINIFLKKISFRSFMDLKNIKEQDKNQILTQKSSHISKTICL